MTNQPQGEFPRFCSRVCRQCNTVLHQTTTRDYLARCPLVIADAYFSLIKRYTFGRTAQLLGATMAEIVDDKSLLDAIGTERMKGRNK